MRLLIRIVLYRTGYEIGVPGDENIQVNEDAPYFYTHRERL